MTVRNSSLLEVPARKFRPELHGVRGLALLGVVLFHLFGHGRVSGGIDIFLTVTGFLFVGMLLRETTETGRVDFPKYFGRLFRRIFAPAAIVIAATACAGYFILPKTEIRQAFAEARASLLYYENFELIRSQLAYGAAGPDTSLYQHFWSLSVQGQVYVMLPILFPLLVLVIGKDRRQRYVQATAAVLGLVLVASLAWAIIQGSYAQDKAYLSTWTRLWEFAFGGLAALALDQIRLRSSLRLVLGWVGLAMIAATGFLFDGGQVFPGPAALWPLFGWLFVMLAGDFTGAPEERCSSTWFLTSKPIVWFADRSYGIYLWHWPIIIFYLSITDRSAVDLPGAALIFLIALALASIVYRAVEKPLAPASESRIGGVLKRNKVMIPTGIAAMLVGVLALTPFTLPPDDPKAAMEQLDPDVYPGAEIVFWDKGRELPQADVFPAPEDVQEFRSPYWYRGCEQAAEDEPGTDKLKVCEDEDAPDHPTAKIALAGGSYGAHWEVAFEKLAKKYGWQVFVLDKGACPLGGEPSQDSACGRYNQNLVDWIGENDIDLVVTSGSRTDNTRDEEYILDRAPYWWKQITDQGAKLMLMRAVARDDDLDIPYCIAKGGTPQECGPKKKWLKDDPQTDLPDGAYSLDMRKYTCPAVSNPKLENCDAVVGNILTSYDHGHFTAPFAASLSRGLEKEMRKDFSDFLKQSP